MKNHYVANGITWKRMSSDPESVARRTKYLVDDDYATKHIAAIRKCKRAKLGAEKLAKASGKASFLSKALISRVHHHLSRGRSVTDIAMREMIPMSVVAKIVEEHPLP